MQQNINRRNFLSKSTGRALSYLVGSSMLNNLSGFLPIKEEYQISNKTDWGKIRKMFELSEDYIHMSAMLISSHPEPVRKAIEHYQRKLNKDHVLYLEEVNREKQALSRQAAATYLGVKADEVALTDSTTMGLGIVYQGLQLKAGDEILLATEDYYSTYETLRLKTRVSGVKMIEVELYKETQSARTAHLVKTIVDSITPATRVIALTWVHSGTGLKLPIKEISEAVRLINSQRPDEEYILLCVDGVHGFGVENFTIEDLGCDIFIAGCHKWLFGPRGTGILWGNKRAWSRIIPIIPSFIEAKAWKAWQTKNDILLTNAALMSPGGFKAFEHLWALPEAFDFHLQIGKQVVARKTHELANKLKHSLLEMSHIIVHTPQDDTLSSGIICFDVKGLDPWSVVKYLLQRQIIASVNPYASRHARLSPSIYNSIEEVDAVIKEVKGLA